MKKQKYQARTLYLSKLFFKNEGEIKKCPDKQKPTLLRYKPSHLQSIIGQKCQDHSLGKKTVASTSGALKIE